MSFSKAEMQAELLRFLSLLGQQTSRLYGLDEESLTRREAIEASPIWMGVEEMYDYGITGMPNKILFPGRRIEGLHASVERFFHGVNTVAMRPFLEELDNAVPRLALRAVQTAVARMVLDGGRRATDYGMDEYGFGNSTWDHLTLAEVALLANMDERSVRNAANPKLADPLKTTQVGKRSLVTPEEARRWLAGRKGFVPTQSVDFEPLKPAPEYNIRLGDWEFVKDLHRKAEENGMSLNHYLNAILGGDNFWKLAQEMMDEEEGKK